VTVPRSPALRPAALFVAAGLVLAVALIAAAPAAAAGAKSCGEQVIDDWYDNQRVDKLYPIHCYRDAIDRLPPDIRDYTGAADAISRALQYRRAGEPDPGPGAEAPGGGSAAREYKPIAFRNTAEDLVALDPQTTATKDSPSTSGPSSVPIPLIVLAGLAGVLLVAGGAGYVARRVQARRGGPPAGS